MDYLIICALIAEVIVLSWVDRKVYGTWLTPFTLLGYPYAAIVVIAFLFARTLDFVPLYTPSVLIWIAGLFIFWLGGMVLGWGVFRLNGGRANPGSSSSTRQESKTETGSVKWAIRCAWAITPILGLGFLSVLGKSGGWADLASPDFRNNYSGGVHAHALVFALALVVLLVGTYQKGRRAQLFAVVVLMIFAVASRVKGTMFQPLIGGLMFQALGGNSRLSLRKILILVPCSFLAFILLYTLTLAISGASVATDWDVYSVLSRHYFFYLLAGPLCLGEAIRTHVTNVGGEWYTLFSPFINLIRALLGSADLVPAGSSIDKGMIIDFQATWSLGEANVYTFFGTPYLYLGIWGGMLYALVASLVCYGLLILAKISRSEWVLVGYCFIGAQLFFGFFELYFWYLTSLELVTYALLVAFFCEMWAIKRPISQVGTVAHGNPNSPGT
jgi:oligosaccharide repeat unit polymerase